MPRLRYPPQNYRVPHRADFDWTEVRDAAAYEIQIAERDDFVPPDVDDTSLVTHFEVDLLTFGPIWWRVRGLDRQGQPGPWSVVRRLEIQPPPLAAAVRAVTVNPTAVAGGSQVDGQVILEQRAPADGAMVLLSASDPKLALAPARLMFAAGETSAGFSIKTAPIDGNAEVNLIAASQGEARSALLRIGPPRPAPVLASVAVHPGVLAAGAVAQGMVTLTEPSWLKATVLLTSSDPSRVTVPDELIVPARATGASFAVRSLHDTGTASVSITASLDGTVKTTALNLTGADSQEALPAPFLLTPSYGTVSAYGSKEFTWTSVTGAVSYTIEVSPARAFDSSAAISRTLPSNSVTISPLAPGAFWWHVRANDANGAPGRWSTPRALRVR